MSEMNPKPQWIDGKLLCQFPGCGRQMWVRDNYCMCEIPGHGGLFPVPWKPEPLKNTWKELLPIANSGGRKRSYENGQRTSFTKWRVEGDDAIFRVVRFGVVEADSVPDGCLVCRYRVGCRGWRTVLLKRVEDGE